MGRSRAQPRRDCNHKTINDGNLEGEKLNDESISEIKKMQYRIKDFQQVYFVSENKIRHQSNQVSL